VQLTLFSDYSLRMLMYLGLNRGRVVPIAEIADSFGVSRHYMLKVMNELTRLGYVDTTRGRSGGVGLARRPDQIRLGKLVRQTEPHGSVLDCVNDEKADCRILRACRLRHVFAEAQHEFYGVLDRYTVADLVEQPDRLIALMRGGGASPT
jgi:Rrf2 family nitric oxide-sensitive transcriptional repressor